MSDTTTETLPSRWDTNASFWVQIIREHRDKYGSSKLAGMLSLAGDFG
jgi:hypothetical protein